MPDSEEERPQKRLKISWWKIAVGVFLVLIDIRTWLAADRDFPEALRASNETQQGAMFLTYCVILLVGLGFIVAGLRAIWLNRS